MRILVFLFFLLIQQSILSQSIDYLPSSNGEVIKHTYYTLSYVEEHEQAEWVAYQLTKEEVESEIKRKDEFRVDPSIKTGSATLADYAQSGYDRGHLAPAADMKMTKESMSESFYFSNMSPQVSSFNRGKWKALEEQFRTWAIEKDSIYIITGGVLMNIEKTIGKNKVSVPPYFYKIALYNGKEGITAIAYLFPNKKVDDELENYIVTIDSVEQLTSIDFFPSLPDELENTIESTIETAPWGIITQEITPPAEDISNKCNGVAKAGERCKNKTNNENGYCHHHQSQAKTEKQQCTGITKSGNRCKRTTTNVSGRCYQHD